jgi:ABC-type transport system involved in multi-copper enzyme maturation permease subunit
MTARSHIFRIACKEFNDRLQSGWVVACFVVWLGAIGLTSCYGLVQVGRIGLQGYERTVLTLLNLVQYLVPLLALLLGQDLLVSEREERTFALMVAGGVSRARVVLGKLVGGMLVLMVPLGLGFLLAGGAIGLATRYEGLGSFIWLAGSGLALGMVCLAIGLAISALCRTRVQALVTALLMWCVAVFAFDLVALGVVFSTRAPAAEQQIEEICDATHVNAVADLHSAYETPAEPKKTTDHSTALSLYSLMLDPVDVFRAVNLAPSMGLPSVYAMAGLSFGLWMAGAVGLALARFRGLDL